jgi:hypothetical protein
VFPEFRFDWSFLCAVLHRQPDTKQLRPRRQHDYVRCGSSGYRNCSRWFWFPLDRLGRMVLQIPETTRSVALYRQEQLISRSTGWWPLSERSHKSVSRHRSTPNHALQCGGRAVAKHGCGLGGAGTLEMLEQRCLDTIASLRHAG